jgi:hypothetical protein
MLSGITNDSYAAIYASTSFIGKESAKSVYDGITEESEETAGSDA